jgi:hypothetical protein
MPHPQSAIFKNHQRAARIRKRPQPRKMEETLDGDRMLHLLEQYLREGEHGKIVALIDVVLGAELLFSSPAKRARFTYLKEREGRARLKTRKDAAA